MLCAHVGVRCCDADWPQPGLMKMIYDFSSERHLTYGPSLAAEEFPDKYAVPCCAVMLVRSNFDRVLCCLLNDNAENSVFNGFL